MKKLNASTVAAAAATITAVAALFVAVWENVQSREYNQLSVRPYLMIEASRTTREGRDQGQLTLTNQGVGPAVIRSLQLRLADDPASGVYENWGHVASLLREQGVRVTGWTDLSPGRPLGIDRELTLLGFEQDVVDGTLQGPSVQDVIESLHIVIEYEAVYGDAFEASWPPEE